MAIDKKTRLSDRVIDALELALEQNDVEIAQVLIKALELSMTRNAGGGEFVERRDFSEQMIEVIEKFKILKDVDLR
jgi:hypothetical protein